MKEISELSFSNEVRYTKDHEWAKKLGDGKVRVGITDYAQDQLGDIVFVDVPEVGAAFLKGAEFGALESVKAVATVYVPVGGVIAAVNTGLEDSPQLVNQAPYVDGWIIDVTPSDLSELDQLMDKDAYIEMLKEISS